MMPGLDGYEVLYQMRNNPITEDASVILLTARSGFPSIYKGWDKGADNYVTKPFDVDKLADLVRQALAEHSGKKRKPPRPDPVLSFSPGKRLAQRGQDGDVAGLVEGAGRAEGVWPPFGSAKAAPANRRSSGSGG